MVTDDERRRVAAALRQNAGKRLVTGDDIEEYRHPERVTARTARPVDREALLALADEMGEVAQRRRSILS